MTDPAQLAADFIVRCCSRIGAYQGSGEPHMFLAETASRMQKSAPSTVFPERYKEHVAHAVGMVASSYFLSPPAAIASVYLVTRFESYFRVLSGVLNRDGTWKSPSDRQSAFGILADSRLKRSKVSNVDLSYRLMKLKSSRISAQCDSLDRALYSTPTSAADGMIISNIGDRIAYGRHAVGHGSRGDISGESVFYGLLTSIVFYAQP